MQTIQTNKIKMFISLHYCFTCGYYMYHPVNTCPVADIEYHMSNIPRDEAHMYDNQGSIMGDKHKSLTDETGAGMAWILANSISKSQFVM